MEKYLIKEYNIYNKLLIIFLKILLITIPLFAYKYVYNFRVNQEAILKLFTLIAVTVWLLKIVNTGKYSFRKTKLDLSLILFSLVLVVSFFISETKTVSLQEFIIFFSYILIFFLITNNLDKKTDFNSFIHLFFIISSIVSIYTIMQYYGFDPYLSDLHRLTSTIGQKNWISNYLAMIFPIVFSYFLLEKAKKIKLRYFFLLSILYATFMICQSRGIWISIILTIVFAFFIIIKFKFHEIFERNKKWLFLLLITFFVITIIYSTDNPLNKSAITVPQRALSTFDEKDPSINTRLLIWKTTLEMIKDRPIFGSGIGTFKMNYLIYQAEFLQKNPNYIKYIANAKETHNEYLQTGAELGLLGLGVFIFIIYTFYTIIINFIKNKSNNVFKREMNGYENTIIENGNCKIKPLNKNYYKEQDNKIIPKKENSNCINHNKSLISLFENQYKDRIIVFGLLMGITCFLIHGLFTFPLHVPALGLTFFIIIGLTLSYIRNIASLKDKKSVIIKKEIFKNKKIKIFCIILLLFFMITIPCRNILF